MSKTIIIAPRVPSAHDKSEWSRMAQAAYKTGRNDVGHRYSAAASLPEGTTMSVAAFDDLQDGYRAWLCFNQY